MAKAHHPQRRWEWQDVLFWGMILTSLVGLVLRVTHH